MELLYKVTLKLKSFTSVDPELGWVDGPVYILDSTGLEKFAETHQYFKVETATKEEVEWYSGRT